MIGKERSNQLPGAFKIAGLMKVGNTILKGLSRLTTQLIQLLLAAVVALAFVYAYNWIHHIAQRGQEWVAITNVKIHSAPDISAKTRIGICEQGTRLQVLGSQVANKRIWYEVEILGQQPKDLKSDTRKWIAAEYVTILRQRLKSLF